MESNSSLSSQYRRISKNCCDEWLQDRKKFYDWYNAQFERQQQTCYYCCLPGDTKDHFGHWFREGRRGKRLEVDRIISKDPYSPENCVLACYPCNNAKSDVFTFKEFIEIGKVINKLKAKRLF
jgi:hypothetical protein